jgi:dipeptidyl aminopeptidase/acylaminoacyl peptidase
MSGLRVLGKRSYVDMRHVGLNGHSHGGYETNVLITSGHHFAAAVEASGPSDLLSGYNGLYADASNQFQAEIGQLRIGATLWQRPDLYLENSPILHADRVTTPLLMIHNKLDYAVPFAQGVELFTALRRLRKPAWMLQYDQSGHAVCCEEATQDFTRRMLQFFDHYLKGAPAPVWMTRGIPAAQKGIDPGYTLDFSGARP